MLAIHLAVVAQQEGYDTLLADLDPHSQTSAEWASERQSDKPLVLTAHAEDIEALQTQAMSEGFDLVIMDCPPYIDKIVKTATKAADFTLIPAQPRFGDIRTLPRVIESVHPPYAVMLNVCPPGHIAGEEATKTKEARQLLEEAGIRVAAPSITRREAFADALNGGEAVVEFDTHGKAADEIRTLWNWIKENW